MSMQLIQPYMKGPFASGVLTDGIAKIIDMGGAPLPSTVGVNPAAGDTIAVSYSIDAGRTYNAWPNGPVTAYSSDILTSGVTHIKFQRTVGSGTTSTYGVC